MFSHPLIQNRSHRVSTVARLIVRDAATVRRGKRSATAHTATPQDETVAVTYITAVSSCSSLAALADAIAVVVVGDGSNSVSRAASRNVCSQSRRAEQLALRAEFASVRVLIHEDPTARRLACEQANITDGEENEKKRNTKLLLAEPSCVALSRSLFACLPSHGSPMPLPASPILIKPFPISRCTTPAPSPVRRRWARSRVARNSFCCIALLRGVATLALATCRVGAVELRCVLCARQNACFRTATAYIYAACLASAVRAHREVKLRASRCSVSLSVHYRSASSSLIDLASKTRPPTQYRRASPLLFFSRSLRPRFRTHRSGVFGGTDRDWHCFSNCRTQ